MNSCGASSSLLRSAKKMKSFDDIPPHDGQESPSPLMSLPISLREAVVMTGDHLCDAKLASIDGQLYNIHRLILAGFSPFLRRLFNKNLGAEIHQVDVSSQTLRNILEFVYHDCLNVSGTNLEDLLRASVNLEFPAIVEKCFQFMLRDLTAETAINYRALAGRYNCDWLREKATDFILDKFFVIVSQSPSFLNLSRDDMLDFLKSDALNAKQEQEVFEAIVKWVNHDLKTRRRSLPLLLDEVRFCLCPPEYLQNVVLRNPLVVKRSDIRRMVMQAKKYVSRKRDLDEILDATIYHARPRIPREIIFVIGGWISGNASSVIETYDSRSNRWLWVPCSDSMPRASHGAVELNGLIYCVGGHDCTIYYNSLRVFDPVTRIWTEKGCMSIPRCFVSVVKLNGYIYVMGGFDGRVRTNTCERYDPKDNQWSLIAEMNSPRSEANATVHENKIYIVGGLNAGAHALRSGEVYDPETNEWSPMPRMGEARSGLGVIAYRNKIYVFGGLGAHHRLRSCIRYDPSTKIWSPIESMNHSRSNFATVVLEDRIYVIGGIKSYNIIAPVERYDEDKNQWENVGSMTYNRGAPSACVVSGLGVKAKDYSFLGFAQAN